MLESLLRESMDAAQIPRGRELTPAGVAEERQPLTVVFGPDGDEARLSEADVVLIRVPAAGDGQGAGGLGALRDACAAVCRQARRGQTIILTATPYVGATRELLVEPLVEAGFEPGGDICIACSPEPIETDDPARIPGVLPRIVGAGNPLCAEKASAAIGATAPSVHLVSSQEAAEMTKLYGDLFRALNVMLADEMSEVADGFGLSAAEILEAVAAAS